MNIVKDEEKPIKYGEVYTCGQKTYIAIPRLPLYNGSEVNMVSLTDGTPILVTTSNLTHKPCAKLFLDGNPHDRAICNHWLNSYLDVIHADDSIDQHLCEVVFKAETDVIEYLCNDDKNECINFVRSNLKDVREDVLEKALEIWK